MVPTNEPLYFKNIKLSNTQTVSVFPYSNFTLIVDEAKAFFKVNQNNYRINEIDGTKYLTIPFRHQMFLNDYIEYHESLKKEKSVFIRHTLNYNIQITLVVNWIFGTFKGTKMDLNKIFLQSLSPYETDTKNCICLQVHTVPESNFTNKFSTSISRKMLNDWFGGDVVNFYKIAKTATSGVDPDYFRSYMREFIIKYDNKYITWLNDVTMRLIFVQNTH
jgi:hypothetical protein